MLVRVISHLLLKNKFKVFSIQSAAEKYKEVSAISTHTKTSVFTLALKKYTYSKCSYVFMLESDISPYDFS
jgi:hypothetical protein